MSFTSETIRFSLVEESEFEKVFKAALTENVYIENSPLWHVKVCPNTKDCAIPEVKEKFPYQYNVIFVFHPAITDGTSNLRIYNHFLSILNCLIKNYQNIGLINSGYHHVERIITNITLDILMQPGYDTKEHEQAGFFQKMVSKSTNLLAECYKDQSAEKISDSIHHEFSTEVTLKILRCSYKHGISVTSFLSCAVLSGVYELLQDTKYKGQKLYDIPHFQMVDFRRHMRYTLDHLYGALPIAHAIFAQLEDKIKSDFWSFAKDYHENSKDPVVVPLCFKDDSIEDDFISDDLNKDHPCYFVINNTGRLDTRLFPLSTKGDVVQISHIKRSTSIKKLTAFHQFCTFRDRMLYSIDYWPRFIPKSLAEKWMGIVIDVIQKNVYSIF